MFVSVSSCTVAVFITVGASVDPATDPKPFFLIGDGTDIVKVNVDGTDYTTVVSGTEDVSDLEYDHATGITYRHLTCMPCYRLNNSVVTARLLT